MEYCELGDLDRYLLNNSNTRLPESEAQDITYQILNALTSMHEETFCHGDLKLAVKLYYHESTNEPLADQTLYLRTS